MNTIIPDFDSNRIHFIKIFDRSARALHIHRKILLLDDTQMFSLSWKEHIEDENRNEIEPTDYEVYQAWLDSMGIKNNS